jgi:tetratricopeptide (TPR) repeat protein
MTAADWRPRIEELHRKVKLHRKRGDALREAGQEEKAAIDYRNTLAMLKEMIHILLAVPSQAESELPGSDYDADGWVGELIEAYGLSGGIHRRLGELKEALVAYREGAKLEERSGATSTYNRVNAVKLALLSNAASLDSLRPAIDDLESLLSQQLTTTQYLSDNAWSWADLGDCRALQGDVSGAERAYRTFVEKAGSQAPKITTAVLKEIVMALQEAGDHQAAPVAQALSALQSRLA